MDIGFLVRQLDITSLLRLRQENICTQDELVPLYHELIKGVKEQPECCQTAKQLIYYLELLGADINHRNKNGGTALHEYLHCKPVNAELVETLLQCGSDLYVRNKYGQTPLAMSVLDQSMPETARQIMKKYVPGIWRAVETGDTGSVRRLVNQWCQVSISKNGKTLQQLALENGTESISCLVRGIEPAMKLAHAVMATDLTTATEILSSKEKVNVNFRNLGDKCCTPLYYAMCNNDIPMIDLLMDHGARMDIPVTTEGEFEMPELFAVINADTCVHQDTILHTLNKASMALINRLFHNGENLTVHCIKENVSPTILSFVLRSGGARQLTYRHVGNQTAYDLALSRGKSEYISVMQAIVIEWCCDDEDDTHRRLLALEGFTTLPQVFNSMETTLKNGPPASISSALEFQKQLTDYWDHIRVFHSAIESGDVDACRLLQYTSEFAPWFDPLLADSVCVHDGQPALHKAVLLGHVKIVQLLAEGIVILKGLRLDNIRDQYFRTALHYACAMEEGDDELTALLLEYGASEHAVDKDFRPPQAFHDRRDQAKMKELIQYHRRKDWCTAEPDPWSGVLPPPIVRYLCNLLAGHTEFRSLTHEKLLALAGRELFSHHPHHHDDTDDNSDHYHGNILLALTTEPSHAEFCTVDNHIASMHRNNSQRTQSRWKSQGHNNRRKSDTSVRQSSLLNSSQRYNSRQKSNNHHSLDESVLQRSESGGSSSGVCEDNSVSDPENDESYINLHCDSGERKISSRIKTFLHSCALL